LDACVDIIVISPSSLRRRSHSLLELRPAGRTLVDECLEFQASLLE
jgi:hypothetical protein